MYICHICIYVPIILINCYQPPSENVDCALDELRIIMDCLWLSNEIYILGDFNLDYSCNGSPTHKKLCLFENSYQLKQLIM